MPKRLSNRIARRQQFALFLVTGLLCVAAPAFAASDSHGPSTMDLVWQAVNLVIVLAVIFAVSRKPVQAFFAERRDQIKGDIEKAATLLSAAEERFKDWQGKIVDLDVEMETIRRDTRERAEHEREQIVAAAHDSAERIKSDALAAIEQETRRAQSELRKEAAHLAVDLAEKILRSQVEDRDRDRLTDEFITRIEPNGPSAGTGR